jgi:hypothetical protein
MMSRCAAAVAFVLCTAGVLWPAASLPDARQSVSDAFDKVAKLKPIPQDRVSTLTVAGRPMTGGPDDFLRRRTGAEILESGITTGCGDNAIALLYLLEKQGFETRFIDSAEISTRSLEYGFSGHAVVAVRDAVRDQWILADPTRSIYVFPWTLSDKSFYGNYWIGFRGRLADYPVHDPESLKKFYRDTLATVPPDVLNQRLFRFAFTVDRSLIGGDRKYRNPNLDRMLRENGKILAAHGVHPVNRVAIRLVAGGNDGVSRLEYSDRDGWVCTLGLQSACSFGLVSYFEERLNDAREKGQLHAMPAPSVPSALFWAGGGILCAGLLAVLFWQRRRLAVRPASIAYWICQTLSWGGLLALSVGHDLQQSEPPVGEIVDVAVYCIAGALLTGLLRRQIRRRRWLTLSTGRIWLRLSLAVLAMAVVQTALDSGAILAMRSLGKSDGQSPLDALRVLGTTALLLAVWTALYVLLTGPRRHREVEIQLQLALREAELRALEAQINPHFLFNCLNSIRGLVVENPAKSQDMLTRLANILRYNLRRDIEHTVPLCSEVEVVGDYLALESARFEDRLRVHISIDPDAAPVQVPPMLLQTLVENALKHGIAPLPAGGDLLVRAIVVGDSMVLEVENPGQVAESAPGSAPVGLANIRDRLRILYNGRASFELKNRDGRVAATVMIPTTA